LRQTWRERVPQALWVAPDGDYATQPRQGAVKMWWQEALFSLCLNCGEFYTARTGVRKAGLVVERSPQ